MCPVTLLLPLYAVTSKAELTKLWVMAFMEAQEIARAFRACHAPMQMMNVEGLTRENVASHLQKFRLQLKRENKLDDEGNLISSLKGSRLAGSEEDVHGSATSQDRDGAGARSSSPSSHQVSLPSVSHVSQADAGLLHPAQLMRRDGYGNLDRVG